MAVYTHLAAEDLAALIAEYDVGGLVSAKGIAEGVSNSNWLIETTGRDGGGARYILTMYERRIDTAYLPFYLGLLDHLSAKDCPVPATIHDREGNLFRSVEGKAVALIEYLPGISVDRPSPAQARAVGAALGRLHLAVEVGAQQAFEEDVQPLAVPGAGHVGLAQAEVAFGQRTVQRGRIVQAHVPGPVAIDADVGAPEQPGHPLPRGGVEEGGAVGRIQWAGGGGHACGTSVGDRCRSLASQALRPGKKARRRIPRPAPDQTDPDRRGIHAASVTGTGR